jgi:hypothetical protein
VRGLDVRETASGPRRSLSSVRAIRSGMHHTHGGLRAV